jgi:hypothetical protein
MLKISAAGEIGRAGRLSFCAVERIEMERRNRVKRRYECVSEKGSEDLKFRSVSLVQRKGEKEFVDRGKGRLWTVEVLERKGSKGLATR